MLLVFLSILGAISYRIGGMGRPFRSWMRDWILPLIAFVTLISLGIRCVWWIHLISYILFALALSTYWDEVPFNKGRDNFFMHGFMCSLAYIPYAIATGLWIPFTLRVVIATVSIGGINYLVNKWKVSKSDVIEECFRGGVLTASLAFFAVWR